jgi:Fic family protein
MNTLKNFYADIASVPAATAWYLADLGEARGKQDLFVRQAPQKLRALREHALIESAVSSNRIEGIEIDRRRVGTIIFGKPPLRDRNEEEVRGYRDALKIIHESTARLPVSLKTVLDLHRLCRSGTGDAGKLKEKEGDIIEKYSDGRVRIRFRTVSPKQTKPFRSNVGLPADLSSPSVKRMKDPIAGTYEEQVAHNRGGMSHSSAAFEVPQDATFV